MERFNFNWKSRIIALIVIAALALVAATPAFAKNARPMKIGTGGPTGNYFGMTNDVTSDFYCKKAVSVPMVVENSKGSVDNLLGMQEKRFSAGLVQEDVLQYFAKQNPSGVNGNRFKVVSGLHQEVLYLMIPKNFKPKSSGWMDAFMDYMNNEDAKPMDLSVLDGQDLAAKGGAVVSAKALKYFTGVNFNIVEVDKVGPNTNMPILLVGGQPYKPAQDLLNSGRFNLISLNADAIQTRAPFYKKTTVNYNLGGKNFSATTVSVRALLIGKSFRNEERNKPMIELGQCIQKSLADLADDPDTNANWQNVYDLEDDGQMTSWPYFPLK